MGNLEEALRLLRQAYSARPDVEIGAHLGEVLWAMGQRDEASRIWAESMRPRRRQRRAARDPGAAQGRALMPMVGIAVAQPVLAAVAVPGPVDATLCQRVEATSRTACCAACLVGRALGAPRTAHGPASSLDQRRFRADAAMAASGELVPQFAARQHRLATHATGRPGEAVLR
jgi:hypothetical protein